MKWICTLAIRCLWFAWKTIIALQGHLLCIMCGPRGLLLNALLVLASQLQNLGGTLFPLTKPWIVQIFKILI
jgi:hypothetical protein